MPNGIEQFDFVIPGDGPTMVMNLLEMIRQKQSTDLMKVAVISRDDGIFEDPEEGIGRGKIARTIHPENILNVRASGMSGDPQDNKDFVNWLKANRGLWAPETEYGKIIAKLNREGDPIEDLFMPRQLWGDYMNRHVWKKVKEEAGAKGVIIEPVYTKGDAFGYEDKEEFGEKFDQQPQSEDGIIWPVKTKDGERLLQGLLSSLAFGLPSKKLPGEEKKISAIFSGDPYNPPEGSILREQDLSHYGKDTTIAIMGTGLTAYDTLVVLENRGYQGNIIMISPQGRLLHPHEESNTNRDKSYEGLLGKTNLPKTADTAYRAVLIEVAYAAGNPENLPDAVKDAVAKAIVEDSSLKDKLGVPRESKYGWQVGMDHVRTHTQAIWMGWDDNERIKFERLYLKLWSQLRHRVPKKVAELEDRLEKEGRLTVMNGGVEFIEAVGPADKEKFKITYKTGFASPQQTLIADHGVNATGWVMNGVELFSSPPLVEMRRKGMIHRGKPIGVEVSDRYDDTVVLLHQLTINKKLEQTGLTEGRTLAPITAKEMLDKHTKQKAKATERATNDLAGLTREVADIFNRYEHDIETIFERMAGRDEEFLRAIAAKNPALHRAIRDIKREDSKITHGVLVDEIISRLNLPESHLNHIPGNSIWNIFKNMREDVRPLLDATARDEFIEQRRWTMSVVKVEIDELKRKYPNFFPDEFKKPVNPDDQHGYGKYWVPKEFWTEKTSDGRNPLGDNAFFNFFALAGRKGAAYDAKVNIEKEEPVAGQWTPKHSHGVNFCMSFVDQGENVLEFHYADKDSKIPVPVYDEFGKESPGLKKPARTTTMVGPHKDISDRFDWHIVANMGQDTALLFHIYDGIVIREDGKVEFETRRDFPNAVADKAAAELPEITSSKTKYPLALRSEDRTR